MNGLYSFILYLFYFVFAFYCFFKLSGAHVRTCSCLLRMTVPARMPVGGCECLGRQSPLLVICRETRPSYHHNQLKTRIAGFETPPSASWLW